MFQYTQTPHTHARDEEDGATTRPFPANVDWKQTATKRKCQHYVSVSKKARQPQRKCNTRWAKERDKTQKKDDNKGNGKSLTGGTKSPNAWLLSNIRLIVGYKKN